MQRLLDQLRYEVAIRDYVKIKLEDTVNAIQRAHSVINANQRHRY